MFDIDMWYWMILGCDVGDMSDIFILRYFGLMIGALVTLVSNICMRYICLQFSLICFL